MKPKSDFFSKTILYLMVLTQNYLKLDGIFCFNLLVGTTKNVASYDI